MRVNVYVTTKDNENLKYSGEDMGFSLDERSILIIHEPVKKPIEGGATRRTIALHNNWAAVELEDVN